MDDLTSTNTTRLANELQQRLTQTKNRPVTEIGKPTIFMCFTSLIGRGAVFNLISDISVVNAGYLFVSALLFGFALGWYRHHEYEYTQYLINWVMSLQIECAPVSYIAATIINNQPVQYEVSICRQEKVQPNQPNQLNQPANSPSGSTSRRIGF